MTVETKKKEVIIPKISYSDFLKNQKPPERTNGKYVDFWLKHINYCKSGVSVGGIFISGWLYWHLNFFQITIDAKDDYGNPVMKIKNPSFRDNEWMLEAAYQGAKAEANKPIPIVGTRRFAKTVFIASRMAYKVYIFQNEHVLVLGASSSDINNITKYFDEFYANRPDCFSDLMKVGDWTKTGADVEIAYNKKQVKKERGGTNPITRHLFDNIGDDNKYTFSRIAVRNLEHGQVKSKEDLLAGITPTEVIWDEALQEDTLIPVPNGFQKIKNLQEGDVVYNKEGKEVKILEKVDVGKKQMYEVRLIDGRYVEACGDHLWEVWDNKLKKYCIKTTEELLDTYVNYQIDKRYDKKTKKRRYSIDLCKPVEHNFSGNSIKLDPYFLGLWLGDGSKSEAAVVTQDDEIKEYLKKYAISQNSSFKVRILKNNVENVYLSNGVGKYNPIREELKKLGLINNKHIPLIYLLGSIQQRKDLLAGLLDTDGTIGKTGHISFSNSSRAIITAVKTLVCGLGIRCTLRRKRAFFKDKDGEKKEGNISYTLNIYPTFNPFRLERKRKRFVENNENKKWLFYRTKVSIDNIVKKGISQAYCLKVDSEDGLFLADYYIVTHNCGKYLWSKQHAALLPAIQSVYGRRCIEIFVATGGNTDYSKDIEQVFMNPEKHNYYHFPLNDFIANIKPEYFPYRQKSDARVGVFVPAEMSLAGGEKIVVPMSDYIIRDYTAQDLKDLEGFTIEVTDWKNAKEKTDKEIEDQKEKGAVEHTKAKMYYPYQPEDSFLTTSLNPFNVEAAKKKQKALYDRGNWGELCELEQDIHGNVVIKPSQKKIVMDYPFKGGTHDAPVVIVERPMNGNPDNIKYGTYVAGFDGYKIATSKTTDSLGAMYIFKRKVGVTGYQYQVVAWIASRPTKDDNFYKQCWLMLKMYNAEVLPERDSNFYKYMENIRQLRYWANCKSFVKGITPNSIADTNYGLPPTTQNQEHYMKLVQKYCNEEIIIGYEDENEDKPIVMVGVERIDDPMLLEEIINYGRYENFDRIVAFGHALAWDAEFTNRKIIGGQTTEDEKPMTADSLLLALKTRKNKYKA